MKKYQLLTLSLSLCSLTACQNTALTPETTPQTTAQTVTQTANDVSQSQPEMIQPVAFDSYKPTPDVAVVRSGQSISMSMKLPALMPFQTLALDLSAAAKIRVTLTDSNGNVVQPAGVDGNGDLPYPPGGNFNVTFNNIYPDRLIVAELSVYDSSAVIPQTQLALPFSHLSDSTANLVMNMSTTPAGKAIKTLLGSNRSRARLIDLNDLQTLVNTITGKTGTTPNFAYTTHPELVNVALLATDLATQAPTALTATAANYRFAGATVNATVAGLVHTDVATLQVTDAASALRQNAGNGLNAILKVGAGSGLRFLASSGGTPGTSYTYAVNPASLPAQTEGGTQAVTVTATPATPTITSLSTSAGTIGSSVTITGTHFHTASAGNVVRFGTTTATVTAASATSLTVTVPAGIAGVQNVTVAVGSQTNAGTNNFAVTPAISSLSSSAAATGTSITINGTGFDTTPGNNTVRFGTTTATVTAATATTLTVTVPTAAAGAQNVTVQVGTQTSAASSFNLLPGVTSLTPNNGIIGSSVIIAGTNFDPTPGNNTVRFGTAPNERTATVTAATATSLTVTVPAAVFGSQNVTVEVNSQKSNGTNNYAVTPTVSSLTPTNGIMGSSVTIAGNGFHTTAGSNTVRFGTTTATVTAATTTSLTVTVPAGIAGIQNVTVAVGSQTNAGTNNFAVTPAISSLSSTAAATGTSITINGTGFDTTPGNNTVRFGTTTATVTAATATTLTVTVPTAAAGAQNVTVQVGTQTSAASSFNLLPGVTSLTPNNGIIGSSVTIAGTNFDSIPGNNTVRFGSTTATVTGATTTSLTVTVPTGISGTQNVTVTNGGQTNTGTNNYAVTPAITSFTSSGTNSDVKGASITLNGTGFDTTAVNNTVRFGGTTATVTGATTTALTVTVPNLTSNAAAYSTTVQVSTQTSAGINFTVAPKMTTFAGTGTAGFSGDTGAANLAQLNQPWGIEINATGHLAIADSANNRVRFIPATNVSPYGVALTAGNIYTVAGDGTAAFGGDSGIGTSGQLSAPKGLTLSGANNIQIVDSGNARIRLLAGVTSATNFNLATTAGNLYTLAGTGTVGVATNGVTRFTAGDNQNGVESVARQLNGTIYADIGNQVIRLASLSTTTNFGVALTANTLNHIVGTGGGGLSGDGAAATSAQVSSPGGLFNLQAPTAADDNLYIADTANHRIRLVPELTNTYFGVAITGNNIATVAGSSNGFSGDGGPATSAQLSSPRGVFVNSVGMWIADTGNHRIRFVPSASGFYYGQTMTANFIYTIAGTGIGGFNNDLLPATLSQLNSPYGVTVDSSNNVYVSDRDNHRIRRIEP